MMMCIRISNIDSNNRWKNEFEIPPTTTLPFFKFVKNLKRIYMLVFFKRYSFSSSFLQLNNEFIAFLKMTSAFDQLKSFCDGKPYKGFSELEHGTYEILNFRWVKNKLYKEDGDLPKRSLLIELEDQVLFLPAYITAKIGYSDEKVDEMNADPRKKYLYFGGRRPTNR